MSILGAPVRHAVADVIYVTVDVVNRSTDWAFRLEGAGVQIATRS